MGKNATRFVAGLIAITALLAGLGPWALYWIGLQGVETLPSPPSAMATAEQRAVAWKRLRGRGPPSVPRLDPCAYLLAVATGAPQDPGVLAAWQVASAHLLEHRRHGGMRGWHLSGAALTIWITRNWTAEQILSAGIGPAAAAGRREGDDFPKDARP